MTISSRTDQHQGGSLAFYLTSTAWLTVWRQPGSTGRLKIAAALLGLTTAILGINFGLEAVNSPHGLKDD